MIKRSGRLLLPLLAGALVLGGCESSSGLGGDGTARVSIQLTDAPGDLKQAQVRITRIYLQGTLAGDTAAGRQEFTPQTTEWIDLLTLAGGNLKTLVQNATIPAGTYQQMRVVIDGAYVVTRDDRVFATPGAQLPAGVTSTGELKCPSCSTSGFKVIFPGGIQVEDGTTLVVDFDVNQSFGHEAGKSGKFILKPVLIGARKGSGESLASISGTVALQNVTLPVACGGESLNQSALLTRVVPTATAGETVKTGTTNGQGQFRIGALSAGSYTLGVAPVGFANGDTLSFTAAASPASVTLASGESRTGVGYTVSAATCKVKAG